MYSRTNSVACLVTCAMIGAGCTHLSGGARIEDPASGTPTSFSGVVPADRDGNERANTRYVFVIHGMGDTNRDYTKCLLKSIEQHGYRREKEGTFVEVALPEPYRVRGEALECNGAETIPPCTFTSFGEYRIDRFQKNTGGSDQTVVVFTYFWNDSMAALQAAFLARDRGSSTGALLNTKIKKAIIDDGFGDATAYLGEAGRLARLGIEGTLCSMLKDAADPSSHDGKACQFSQLTENVLAHSRQAEYSFLSFSLGSRMLYDVLSGMRESSYQANAQPPKALLRFVARTRNFFMAANQMPLLGVGRVSVMEQSAAKGSMYSTDTVLTDCDGGFFGLVGCARSRKTAGLLDAKSALAGEDILSGDLQVIAFHDPGDLLGFRASGGMHATSGIKFIEVTHRNTPVILWLLAWPGSAHATELERDDSRALILCGGLADANGKLRAEICR